MPYVIEKDATLPRVIARGTDPDGNEYAETENVSYRAGQVVYEDDIAPRTLERLESGDDDHLSSLARHVSESEAEKLLTEQSVGEPVAPEHEAEAEVLHQDGKDVLTRKEVVELNLNGDAVAEEVSAPDLKEGREAESEGIRSTEVDAKRRGEGDAPEPVPAAEDPEGSDDEDKTVAELKSEAKELGVSGFSNMKKDELQAAIAAEKDAQASKSDEGQE